MTDLNRLVLMGLLHGQGHHGYELHDIIEKRLSCIVSLKKATAYSMLERMHAEGLVQMEESRSGKRPARRVYRLSPAGEAAFREALRESLASPAELWRFGDPGLLFSAWLPPAERRELLLQRKAALEAGLAALQAVPGHAGRMGPEMAGIDLAVSRQRRLVEADLAWLADTLEMEYH